MVAKNRMVGLTEPAIGHHGGDLDHSIVRYRTIEAIERPFLPMSPFAVLSGQPKGYGTLLPEGLVIRLRWTIRGLAGRRNYGPSRAAANWKPSTM